MTKKSLSYEETALMLKKLRRDYGREILDEKNLCTDPIDQFNSWFEEALQSPLIAEANAMTLSTADRGLHVTSRILLLKGYDKKGFRFFTNSKSTKGQQMAENPHVALHFYWAPLERQVKIHGRASLLPRTSTEEYFYSRPRGSQLGAIASEQSALLESRAVLEDRMKELEQRFENQKIPLPDFWNGYLVEPDSIEFWQGRPNRLHDRLRYTKKENGDWKIERLNP